MLYSNRCTAYIALEQYEKAMEDADECVRLQPSWAKGYLRRGSVFFRMGQLERAEQVREEPPRPRPTLTRAARKEGRRARPSSPDHARPGPISPDLA